MLFEWLNSPHLRLFLLPILPSDITTSERHSASLMLAPSIGTSFHLAGAQAVTDIFIFRGGPKCLGSALALAIGELESNRMMPSR